MINIDGIIFSLQKQGGISVYFRELLTFLDSQNVPALLTIDAIDGATYSNAITSSRVVTVMNHSSRLLERYRSCRTDPRASLFHSSYYRLPSDRDLPTVLTVHDFVYERYQMGLRKWVHSAQKNLAIRSAQSVICVSESTKNDLLEFVGETPGQNIYVIHNGVSDIFQQLKLHSAINPYVLFVGQRGGYKNFQLLLKAMEFLPELSLFCVGGGTIQPKEIENFSVSVSSRVRHVGFVSDEQLNILYNQAICLAYPSSYEGFGIPVIEAMRSGCPVVCIKCKAILEVGKDALTVAAESDPRALADAILKTTSSERSTLIDKGLAVARNYSWSATHQKTLEIYRKLVS